MPGPASTTPGCRIGLVRVAPDAAELDALGTLTLTGRDANVANRITEASWITSDCCPFRREQRDSARLSPGDWGHDALLEKRELRFPQLYRPEEDRLDSRGADDLRQPGGGPVEQTPRCRRETLRVAGSPPIS